MIKNITELKFGQIFSFETLDISYANKSTLFVLFWILAFLDVAHFYLAVQAHDLANWLTCYLYVLNFSTSHPPSGNKPLC